LELFRSGGVFNPFGSEGDEVSSGGEKLRVLGLVPIHGVRSARDQVIMGRDMGGVTFLMGRLSHSLGIGVVFAVEVATEGGVLEGVFTF